MCLILVAYQAHPDFPLVIASNRDEFYERPTEPAAFWQPETDVLGGRDLSAGGTWMAAHRAGKLAAVTNVRRGLPAPAKRSRGHLVSQFLNAPLTAAEHLQNLLPQQNEFGGFNLLLWDRSGLHYASNHHGTWGPVSPGLHGLSNHLLDTAWPKVELGKSRLRDCLRSSQSELAENLFALLSDRTPAPDARLPDTGVGLERERMLSPAFIHASGYGTRASTVAVLHRSGQLDYIERGFDGLGTCSGERRFTLRHFADAR